MDHSDRDLMYSTTNCCKMGKGILKSVQVWSLPNYSSENCLNSHNDTTPTCQYMSIEGGYAPLKYYCKCCALYSTSIPINAWLPPIWIEALLCKTYFSYKYKRVLNIHEGPKHSKICTKFYLWKKNANHFHAPLMFTQKLITSFQRTNLYRNAEDQRTPL